MWGKPITTDIPKGKERTRSDRFLKDYSEQYFEDGKRIIDYILVYNAQEPDRRRTIFINALQEIGIELEEVRAMINPDLIFIKVHGPKLILFEFAQKYDIPIKKLQRTFIRAPVPKLKIFRTELTSQDPKSPNFLRAPETLSGDKPKKCSRNERMLIMYNILKRIVYGPNKTTDIGINHLLEKGVFEAAYPPHDGPSNWSKDISDPINDRQLLRKYWSAPRNFFKSQPLDVIEQYFGDNIALYFAWLNFYNKMLFGPILIGLIVTVFNYCYLAIDPIPVTEACNSNIILCPTCKDCKSYLLKESCMNYKFAYVTDNYFTIAFATVMSFWASIYLVLWQRKQAVLTLRWNIKDSNMEEQDIRPEFENFAKHIRMNEFGEPELYIPLYTKFWRKSISYIVSVLMAAVLIVIHVSFIVFEIIMAKKLSNSLMVTYIAAVIIIFVIMTMRRVCISVYEPIAIWLVNLEVPETQTEFDNSYIMKIFLFSFVNNYTSLIYIAYFKGKFFTHPNDPSIYQSSFPLTTHVCDPSGCTSEVSITFQLLMTFMPLMNLIVNYIYKNLVVLFNRSKERKAHVKHSNMPRWEKDFELIETQPYDLLKLYEEMVVQFGFVTLFAFAFPAAPLFALITSLIKTHVDAHCFVVKNRRPQAKRTASIGAWMDIMTFLTYFSIVTNACYMTFTSDFVSKHYYLHNYSKDLHGYVNYTLSPYKMNTDHWPKSEIPNGTICWYSGFRNPPDHVRPYELNYHHFYMFAIKIGVILAFEHVISALTAILSYSIPTVPSFVRERLALETMELRKYTSDKHSFTIESLTRLPEQSSKEGSMKNKK